MSRRGVDGYQVSGAASNLAVLTSQQSKAARPHQEHQSPHVALGVFFSATDYQICIRMAEKVPCKRTGDGEVNVIAEVNEGSSLKALWNVKRRLATNPSTSPEISDLASAMKTRPKLCLSQCYISS